jgi:type VI secretion system ImpB/VipA family protein
MDDFNPSNIVGQVEVLGEEDKKRVALTDLLSKLDGNDALDAELRNIIADPEALNQLQRELKLKK